MKVSILLALILISTCVFAKKTDSDDYVVERIVDGDTLVLSKLGKVRLIGVDTPETKDPRKPVQYFGKEATEFLHGIAFGKKVRVEFGQNKRDRYGRVLAYLYLADGTLLNYKTIEEGYGFAYTKYPFEMMDKFRSAERAARSNKKGLWGNKANEESKSIGVTPNGKFECLSKTCSVITSCEEAKFLLNNCGFSKLDGDKDGVPCEKLCR